MKARSWYNEIDPQKAAWLRELIREGHIADGIVDETSIERIRPVDIASFTQCHFFAGIGVWSHALRSAGWSDDTPVWTGSCPCQGFSASGKREGFSDERHLWPAWFRLIRELRPERVFGEQVASNDGLAWFDIVSSDMEGEGYSIGACDTCAAGFGAPHIRQRLYFVADAQNAKWRPEYEEHAEAYGRNGSGRRGISGLVADALSYGTKWAGAEKQFSISGCAAGLVADAGGGRGRGRKEPTPGERRPEFCDSGATGELGHSKSGGCGERGDEALSRSSGYLNGAGDASGMRPGPVNGFWRDSDWLLCTDGKWRPVKPGSFPLAHGSPARVGRLRGYGDGIVAPQAAAFVRAWMGHRA